MIPLLSDRERLEIDLALLYADRFNHGTDGHTRLVLIAKLVREIERLNGLLENKPRYKLEGDTD